jgi:hypothetical protein
LKSQGLDLSQAISRGDLINDTEEKIRHEMGIVVNSMLQGMSAGGTDFKSLA